VNTHIAQGTVGKAKPPASGYYTFYDDKIAGFGIRVTAAGAKSFVYNYRVGGSRRRFTIGPWPEWSADAARDGVLDKLCPAIHGGADPAHDKKALRAANTECYSTATSPRAIAAKSSITSRPSPGCVTCVIV